MSPHLPAFLLAPRRVHLVVPSSSDEPSNDQSGSESEGGLVSDLGSEIKVTLDRWSVGQLGVSDLVAAGLVIVGGFVVAFLVRRLIRRSSRHVTGVALVAVGTVEKLVGASIYLLAAALALEILGFSLGPVLILILIAIVVLLLLRPMITNLSSGLLLQLRGAIDAGDLVETTRDGFGVVSEITSRTTVLDTSDGRRIHVPNSDVLNDAIVNYTTLGGLRSSFDIMVSHDEDLDLITRTIHDALADVDEVRPEPQPEVQVARVVGRLVVIRVRVWHPPSMNARNAALDVGIRSVLNGLSAAGIALDGPTLVAVDGNGSASKQDDDDS